MKISLFYHQNIDSQLQEKATWIHTKKNYGKYYEVRGFLLCFAPRIVLETL
jgi:hypothetical protein